MERKLASIRPFPAEWKLYYIVFILCVDWILCGGLPNSRSSITYIEEGACEKGCSCHSLKPSNTAQAGVFFVNCARTSSENTPFMKYDLSGSPKIPRNKTFIPTIPINTTHLLVTGYNLQTLNVNSFSHTKFKEPLINLVSRFAYAAGLVTNKQKLLHPENFTTNITQLNTKMFPFLYQLISISVANNHIYNVEKGSFLEVNQVKLLNMSYNFLEQIDSGVLYEVQNLEILDVSHNKLESLPWKTMSQMSSLKRLGLKGNFWNCSCEMKDILKLDNSLLIGTQAMCHFPVRLKGTLLEELNFNSFLHCFATEQRYQNITKDAHLNIPVLMITMAIIIASFSTLYGHKQFQFRHSERLDVSNTASSIKYVGNIWFNSNDALDQFGTVFKGGLTDGREAAIKRHPKMKPCKELKCKKCNELDFFLHLAKAQQHPNVIQYLWNDTDNDFTYLALDLCAGDLMTAVMERVDGFDIVDPQNFFLQLASGLTFLHENHIEHRDIKPQNILWKRTVNGVVPIFSDFDLSHLNERKSSSHAMRGTKGWSAPELWCKETRSTAVDIFSLGCVYYFILTRGHPFGPITDLEECHVNIISTSYKATFPELHELENEKTACMAENLVEKMICTNSGDRIEACRIKEHPLFWNNLEMKGFLKKIGNYTKDQDDPDVAHFKMMLEEGASTVFEGSWLDKLHSAAVRSDLKSYEKENQDQTICGLLLAIRNKIEHFSQIRNLEVRQIYLGSEDGVVEYYTRLFPRLIPYTYNVLKQSNLI
ncbi:uncharacterized protein LOC114537513 isoform X2 [Dendronephthya gigantea]|uniref:uncharacterized protein LOC114537513 isoform X2 n=1 Tax=Dendronephthya gigantea TaxID=151771 RepID=UPI00106ABD32|nr:uncharacterized protein LOC114537513 isoform X2 [Dendronephthya gigantea]